LWKIPNPLQAHDCSLGPHDKTFYRKKGIASALHEQCIASSYSGQVLITSSRNQNLGCRPDESLYMHGNSQGWEQWTIHDAGTGKVFIRNHHNKHLGDSSGSLYVHDNTLAWEQWTITDAGDGKVFIKSHRNQRLTDQDGTPSLSGGNGASEKWQIRHTSGQSIPCLSSQVRPFYLLPKGFCCCPWAQQIQTLADCRDAHDDLGLQRNHEWTGNNGGIPAGCSTRQDQSHNLHFSSRTKDQGTWRNDMTPICKATDNV